MTIAGEGPQLEDLQKLAKELGIASAVSFPGFVSQSELRELFYSSHMFLHPSETGRDGNQEGVPNSLLEAMATGLAVFATRHGGIPEAVENGVSGVLVDERDDEALAKAIIFAAQHFERFSEMGSAAATQVAAAWRNRFPLSPHRATASPFTAGSAIWTCGVPWRL